jgi:hypothetical protein
MYDPERRISASEALEHQYFKLVPRLLGLLNDADKKGEPASETS